MDLFRRSVLLFLALLPVFSAAQVDTVDIDPALVFEQKAAKLRPSQSNRPGVFLPPGREFVNIGKQPYYRNELALERLKEAREEENLEKLNSILEAYIDNFGIENFRRDAQLLWEKAFLSEALGDTAGAIFYYELARTHGPGQEKNANRYDSLKATTETDWLSLDDYFSLLEVRRRIDPLIPPRKVLENMGDKINSKMADYAPFVSASDSILIYTSRRDPTGRYQGNIIDPFYKPQENLFISVRDFVGGKWQEAEMLDRVINSGSGEGSACLAPDGKTLYFTRCNAKGGVGNCDIWEATFDGESWENIRNLGPLINSGSWDSQPNISADGLSLYFASNRLGGFGGVDLYVCQREGEEWSKPRNLGPIINSPGNDVTPFFHEINNTLYFSSTGQPEGFGGFDIYKARKLDRGWEFPTNIGPLVNTAGNEYYFAINGSGETIYYANSMDPDQDHIEQNFDLFSFPMPMEARPDAIAQLKGFLLDSITGHPLTGVVMVVDLQDSVEIAPKKINENGYFEFDLINDNRYRIFVLGEKFLTIKRDFTLQDDTTFNFFTQSFEENRPIVFEAMEFPSNSSKLTRRVEPYLDYIIRFLHNYPMFDLIVEGHTDADGESIYNLKLSEERAERIADYIITRGSFDPGRITSKGYGETKPVLPNDSPENKRKNRRVEFKLVLNEDYAGDLWLPTEEELMWESSDEVNEFLNEEWSEEELEEWNEELEIEDPFFMEDDLEAELRDLESGG